MHYLHLVFSVPHTLVPLMWQNKKILFALLFEASAATLLELAADPQHLGAEIGFFSILHTWGQTLQPHPHIHCVVPGGGLAPDHQRWLSTAINFFLPVLVLSPVFCGKFLAGLRHAFRTKQLVFHGECLPLAEEQAFRAFLDSLREQDWVVYAKPPFGGPDCGDAHAAMRPWRSWNDSTPQSCSISKGSRNASLTVPRKTVALAISWHLSSHLLEVCLDSRKRISLAIDASLRPISLEVPQAFSSLPLSNARASLSSHAPKKRIENT